MKFARSFLFFILLIASLLLALFITSSNQTPVHVNFIFGEADSKLSVVIGYAFVAGLIVALIACLLIQLVNLSKLKFKTSKIKSLEDQIVRLKSEIESHNLKSVK